ncbi:MAG: hypothetical protein HW402_211 [Dehalococcoidales bacterium]|nr:hypothetical protein [Dehalococcoidales bacterium]
MTHLIRAAMVILVIVLLLFVGLRIVPVPAVLVDFGFHPRNTKEDIAAWASLPVQYALASVCTDCHQSEYVIWEKGNHKTVACENCHGPARSHLETGARPIVDTSRQLCGTCHEKVVGRPANFPQVDMTEMGGQANCVTCHSPHDPRAGMPPQVPHALAGRSTCLSCHGEHEPWVEPPPEMPHTLAGRTECLSCHGPDELRGATLPQIPHTLAGRSDCLACHSATGIKPVPKDHVARTSSTCLNCHQGGVK